MKQVYLRVLRTLRQTCANDPTGERQISLAIRRSISELVKQKVSEDEISKELELTEQMLRLNIAQVSYNERIDSFAVKITEEMVPQPGAVVDISTPQDYLASNDLDRISATHLV